MEKEEGQPVLGMQKDTIGRGAGEGTDGPGARAKAKCGMGSLERCSWGAAPVGRWRMGGGGSGGRWHGGGQGASWCVFLRRCSGFVVASWGTSWGGGTATYGDGLRLRGSSFALGCNVGKDAKGREDLHAIL